MGKTVLWEEAIDAARARGIRVLDARPTDVEAGLAFAGINELLRDVPSDEIRALPAPQRRALQTALYGEGGDQAGPYPPEGARSPWRCSPARSLAARGPDADRDR
ncbi:MAG: hypothetical protein R3C32_00215 [Chloroflexota bacterium]